MNKSMAAFACILSIAGVPAIPAAAQDLNSADPYESAIFDAIRCDKAAIQTDYALPELRACQQLHDGLVARSEREHRASAKQRNGLLIARGLSMLTVAAGHAEIDGKVSADVCRATRNMAKALAAYDANATPNYAGIVKMLEESRDLIIPKCQIGGTGNTEN